MGQADYLELGTWNAQCWNCGFKFKANQLLKNWQGYFTCYRCYETRQPQDYVRGVPDVQTPPWVQPKPGASYAYFCAPNDLSAVCGQAICGCAKCGYISPMFFPEV